MSCFNISLLCKDLYAVIRDKNPADKDVNALLVVLGSITIDDQKLTPILKQIDNIDAIPYTMRLVCNSDNLDHLVVAIWTLSNYASIKRYTSEDFLTNPIFIDRLIELY